MKHRRFEDDHRIALTLTCAVLCALCTIVLNAPSNVIESFAATLDTPTPRPTWTVVWLDTATPTATPTLTATPSPCDEVFRLAGALDAEGRSQPEYVRMAMSAIVVREARSRQMSICALTERTNFLSVWHYAQRDPFSWHAQQFARPSESSLRIARDALAGQFDALRNGAMHFDGAWQQGDAWACRPEVLWRGGTTCFYP